MGSRDFRNGIQLEDGLTSIMYQIQVFLGHERIGRNAGISAALSAADPLVHALMMVINTFIRVI